MRGEVGRRRYVHRERLPIAKKFLKFIVLFSIPFVAHHHEAASTPINEVHRDSYSILAQVNILISCIPLLIAAKRQAHLSSAATSKIDKQLSLPAFILSPSHYPREAYFGYLSSFTLIYLPLIVSQQGCQFFDIIWEHYGMIRLIVMRPFGLKILLCFFRLFTILIRQPL